MKPWINYHHLLYFKLIAEHGSISKAAEIVRLGQPALSSQLKTFEDSIGAQLFERKHKKLILTEQGKVALEYAQKIFSMGNEMLEVLQDKLGSGKIHLQIGALDSIPKQIILQMAKLAYSKHDCHLSLKEGRSDEMLRELSAHRIDLFVTNYLPQSDGTRDLRHRRLSQRTVSVYASPKFKKLRKDFPGSLEGQKFILPTYESKLRYDFEHWAKLNGITFDIIAETQDIAIKKLMAIDGLGLIPSASHVVSRQVLKGELVELGKLSNLTEELYLITAHRRRANPVAVEIMQEFQI